MSPEAQRIAIAEACGWREAFPTGGSPHPETKRGGILLPYNWVNEITHERAMELPNYLTDLNVMHEAEMTRVDLEDGHFVSLFREHLHTILGHDGTLAIHATAAQRAEAFLRTIGKWDDSK